jgi:hypothetical protein
MANTTPDETEESRLGPSPALRQVERNLQTRGLTESFASHRTHMMEFIRGAALLLPVPVNEQRSLTILGAGNCLDIDLQNLCELFSAIRLIDIDRSAVEFAVARQAVADRVQITAPLDLADPLNRFLSTAGPTTDVASVLEVLSQPFSQLPAEPADLVVSACVLSQILESLAPRISQSRPGFEPLIQALRRGHLRRMLQLLKSDGYGLFVSDLVSSETVPELATCTDAELPSVVKRSLNDRNFFSGLNPAVVLSDLQQELSTAESQSFTLKIFPPWKWQMGPRVYAVYAILFSRP